MKGKWLWLNIALMLGVLAGCTAFFSVSLF